MKAGDMAQVIRLSDDDCRDLRIGDIVKVLSVFNDGRSARIEHDDHQDFIPVAHLRKV